MAIISARFCEIEIQEQTEDCEKKYCVFLKYEPYEAPSTEIATMVMTDVKPIVRQTLDCGNAILNKDMPVTDMNAEVERRTLADSKDGKKINWNKFFGNSN